MKVLLKEDVEHLGYAGEVYKVAPGYGRNYLLPRGLAVRADKGTLAQAAAWRDRAEARRAELKAEYDALSAKIEPVILEFEARAGTNGRLYGSITDVQITEALNAQVGTSIDRKIVQTGPIRELGEHDITVRLDKDHLPQFKVIIRAEGAAEAEALAAAEAAAAEALAAEEAQTTGEGFDLGDDVAEAVAELFD